MLSEFESYSSYTSRQKYKRYNHKRQEVIRLSAILATLRFCVLFIIFVIMFNIPFVVIGIGISLAMVIVQSLCFYLKDDMS